MNAFPQQLVAQPLAREWHRLRLLSANVAIGVALALALLLAARRVAVEQVAPLAIPTTLATAVAVLLVAIAIRRAAAGRIVFWLPTLLVGVWAVVCSYPGTQPLAWLVWTAAIAADLLLARRLANASITASGLHDDRQVSPSELGSVAGELLASAESPDEVADDGEVVLQHIVRMRDGDGNEYIHATLRGELAAGDRRTTLYLGFCPPLSAVPQVEAEVIEGPAGIAKVVQTLHNGAQIEVDLDAASLEPSVVTVEVAAYPREPSAIDP